MNYKLIKTQFFITIGLIFLSTIFIFEIPPRLLSFFEKKILRKNYKQRCDNLQINEIQFEYGLCPNNKFERKKSEDYPLIPETLSYTDSLGGRVDKKSLGKNFEKNEFNLFLIGDSFIHADELPYEKTVYGIINNSINSKNLNAYAFAYASWNTETYLKSIKAINANNSLYDIFLFPNDITPSYGRSRYGSLKKKSNLLPKKKYSDNFLKRRLEKTIIFQKIRDIYLSKKSTKITQNFWSKYTKEKNKCKFLENNKNYLSPKLVDYIYFSLPYKCWTEIHKKAYSLVLQDINNMKEEAEKRNSKIRIMYLPAPFSFKGENFPGRTHYYYGLPKNIEIKTTGLTEKLKNDIGKIFIDLEGPIRMELSKKRRNKDCLKENCNNLLYYPYDGHLNEEGHKFLYDHLYLNLSSNFK